MYSWLLRRDWIWLGWLSVWIMLAGVFVVFAVSILAGVRQVDLPLHILKPIQDIFFYGVFIFFLLGLREYAIRKGDDTLVALFNTLIWIDVAMSLFLLPGSFPRLFSEEFILLGLVSSLPLICIYGVTLYRIAVRFELHAPELGNLGKRLVWWNKVAGWMTASIVLAIPGLFFYFVGYFFFWRLLARELKKEKQLQSL